MRGKRSPTYDLVEVQQLMSAGRYQVTGSARRGAAALTFTEGDIRSCVLGLIRDDFYKSMASERLAGAWQDVYRPTYGGVALYVKLQLRGEVGAVVISFKRR